MKKLIAVLLFISATAGAQSPQAILDHEGYTIGTLWTYSNGTQDLIAPDGTILSSTVAGVPYTHPERVIDTPQALIIPQANKASQLSGKKKAPSVVLKATLARPRHSSK